MTGEAGGKRVYRILVVDDDPDAAEVVGMLLVMIGHETRVAFTGVSALEVAETFALDVAIIDIGLPDLCGYEVGRALRRRSADRPLYLVAISGWGGPEERARAAEAGFDEFLQKPADGAVLARLVGRIDNAPDGSRERRIIDRERAVANRETWLRAREHATGAHEVVVTEREQAVTMREQMVRARSEADAAATERERLVAELREANERLVVATLRADEAAEAACAERDRGVEGIEAIRASEARLRTLADAGPMLAWYAEANGEIAWLNERWSEYTGTVASEHLGWRWTSALDPEHRADVIEEWKRAVATGVPWEAVFRLRAYDGTLRWFLSRALPVRDTQGAVERWFGTTVDIDAQKHAEVDARADNRAKDQFLAMLGHELRNPLAPILTALDLISLQHPEAFRRERAIIQRQVRHLVRLVDDMLDVSRITQGKVELHRERLEVADVFGRALEIVGPLFAKRDQEVVVRIPSTGIAIDGDDTRLVQVIANILTNASKYTPSGGSVGVVAVRHESTAILRVRDTGIGITAAMLPHVFDLFAQERQGRDRSQGGLGLGLAIVKMLVRMHGGTVSAHSDGIGRGSEFVVELPLSTAADVPVGSAPSVAEWDGTETHRVLVVDDNRDAADLAAELLTALGDDVRVAYDGASAIEIAHDFAPDVALLDIGLPAMDGYELAARLRAATNQDLRFIAITGYGQEVDRRRSAAAGFDLHLVKPVTAATLHASIHRRRA